MKKTITYFSAVFFTLSTLSLGAQTLYWDINGAAPGAGGANPSGTWDTTTANWTTTASGSPATVDWTNGNTAYFAAGSDASGSYTVTVSGTQSPNAIIFGYGDATLSGGVLEFAGGGGIEVDASQAAINSVIDGGTGPLNMLLFGTLTLSGNNTFSNTVSVVGTTLRMGASGDILPLASVSISSGATLDLNNLSVGIGALTGAGDVTLGSGTLTNLGNQTALQHTGVISGSGSSSGFAIVKTGAKTAILNGANTFTDKILITGGILAVKSDSGLGTAPASPVADQITISNGGALQLTATAVTIPVNRGVYIGLPYGILAVNSSQTPTVLANITGPGSLQKGNSGNVNLDGTNTFSGGFTITGGGVRINNDIAAGTGPITVAPASIVTLRNIAPNTTNSTVTNAITLNDNTTSKIDIDLTAAQGNTFTLSGPISGVGYMTRGRAGGGGGNVVLSGDNSGWSGGLVFNNGVLTLGHKNALGTGLLSVNCGTNNSTCKLQASLPLTGANAVSNPININATNVVGYPSLIGANALELSGPINLGTNNVTITNNNTGGTIFSGVVSGAAGIGLTMNGTGVLTLSGANNYTGPTTINAGTLLVDSPGSLSSSSAVTVNAGGTLGGSGTINGSVTVASAGTISAGDSPGTLTLANGLDLSAGGTNVWELAANSASNPGTDFDQIVLTSGSLALGGSSALQVNFTGSVNFTDPFWGANHNWTIISGSNPGSTTFPSLSGTNGITAGTFAVSADTSGVYLDYTTAAAPQPRITNPVLSGGNFILQGTGGTAGGSYSVLTSTNVALPLANWTTNITGIFTGTGAFSNGIPVSGSPGGSS